jgi:c(7)-type cytochrome triheme protein
MTMGKLALIVCLLVVASSTAEGKIVPAPSDYGAVIISNYSSTSGSAPVRFDHWLHRAFFTCRLCHVDIGFAMEANGTKISAETNMKGFYCGSCHNGKLVWKDRTVFPSCRKDRPIASDKSCSRCHSGGGNASREYEYGRFTEKLPKQAVGNLVDWEEAENRGLISPLDFLPGVSVPRAPLKAQADFSILSRGAWMPDIIFSHKKHTQWNGCELCHPEIFPTVRKDSARYTMFQIVEGQYCGACHRNVAFPLNDCEKCHSKPARQ